MTKVFFRLLVLGTSLPVLFLPCAYSFSMATPKPSKHSQSAKEDPTSIPSFLSEESISDGLSSVQSVVSGQPEQDVLKTSPNNEIPSSSQEQQHAVPRKNNNASVGIILNTNARRVTHDLVPVAREVLGEEYVHVTNNADEARDAARILLEQNVSMIVPVGGDGTLSSVINFLCQERIKLSQELRLENHLLGAESLAPLANNTTSHDTTKLMNGDRSSQIQDGSSSLARDENRMTVEDALNALPLIGYIPLGTGNGLGSVVACRYPTKCRTSLLTKLGSKLRFLRRKEGQEPTGRKHQDFRNLLDLLVQVGNQLSDNESATQGVNGCCCADETSDPMELVNIVEIPMMELTTTVPTHHTEKETSAYTASEEASASGGSELCFFAGVGFDSLMLEDFKVLKAWSNRTKIFTSALSSVLGYCVALVTRTLPKCVTRSAHQVNVQISTRDPDTLWVDHRRGDIVQRAVQQSSRDSLTAQRHAMMEKMANYDGNVYESNNGSNGIADANDNERAVLYEGTAGIVAGATTPFYGGGLRLFPFARMTIDKMHLRVGRIHPLRGFINIPGIFAGSYRDTRESTHGCIDFIGDDFEITILPQSEAETTRKLSSKKETSQNEKKEADDAPGYPLQHSGESIGNCEKVRLRVVKEPIRFITFLEKRLTHDGPGVSRN